VESQRQRANTYTTIDIKHKQTHKRVITMKKQWLVNLYRKGQARVDDRSKLDDAECKAFDGWWKKNAHRYKDEHPNLYDNFEAFYDGDDAEVKSYDQLELLSNPDTTETPQGDKVAPGFVIDDLVIEDIVNAIKSAGYELRKISDSVTKSWDDLPVLMTPEEVQAVLRISRATFFRLIKEGKIAGATKQGGSWLIDKEALRASTQK
jgi:excisionase family DNA binding protein